MSGELTLSQFRLTTTDNNDFVIGSLEDTPNPTEPRFLVFQTTKLAGWQHNPHIRFDPVQTAFLFSKDGTAVSQFILSDTVNTFTENNTFTKNVVVNGLFSATGNVVIGDNAGSETLTVNSATTFLDSVVFDSTINDVVFNTPNTIFNTSAKFSQNAIVVNYQGASASGGISGILIEEGGATTGYIRSTANRNGISLKGPARRSINMEGNASFEVTLTSDEATAIQTYKLPPFAGAPSQTGILPSWEPSLAYASGRVVISSSLNNKLLSVSSVTAAEVAHLSGVNSNIQTSLINLTNNKMNVSGGTFSGAVTFASTAAFQSTTIFSSTATFNGGFTGNHSAGSLLGLTLPAGAGTDGQTLIKSGTSWAWGSGGGGGSFSLPAGFTTGDLLVGSGSMTAARLAAGTEGDILKIVSGIPAWAAAGGGGSFDTAGSYTLTGDWTFNQGIIIKDSANTDLYRLRVNNGIFEIVKL